MRTEGPGGSGSSSSRSKLRAAYRAVKRESDLFFKRIGTEAARANIGILLPLAGWEYPVSVFRAMRYRQLPDRR